MPSVAPAIRCVIVDDHRMVLDLLVAAVSGIPGLTIAATATDVADADRLAALSHVDLLIVDQKLGTADGMGVVRAVAALHPGLRCIVIADKTAEFSCPPDLLDVVVSVVDKTAEYAALAYEIARVVNLPADAVDGPGTPAAVRSRLTARQWELFVALGEGLSSKELAQRFGITTRTVETHRKAIARKLGASGAALVRLAAIQRRPGADT